MKQRYFSLSGGILLAALNLLGRPAAAQGLRLDPSFQPPQITPASPAAGPAAVQALVRQPDGKYLIGGSFGSINGVRVRNLARLNADGTLDTSFSANCPANGTVHTLALQADGHILVGGSFDSLAGAARPRLGRLAPNGTLDAGFTPVGLANIRQVAVLPNGDVLALNPTGASNYSPPRGLYRLNGTSGQPVTGFQQAVEVQCFAVQPDGKILTGGGSGSYVLMHLLARLQPDGRLDPTFTPVTTYFTATTLQVAQHTDGTIYYNSQYTGLVGHAGPSTGQLNTFALQPDGRILLMPLPAANSPLTARLLATGQPDASYLAANGPRASATGTGNVFATVIQPDGAILYAGDYALAGTTTVWGLARFLDNNALTTRAQAQLPVAAWPNPAADRLHLRFEAASQPQQVTLLDNVGRVVRRQPVRGTAELTLDVAELPAGAYVLRVDDAQTSPRTQRVLLQR
ncbi:T9SS type A sorting domain-containing protein [Hymenobacter sp. 15J16-1T3B]|uniref:T9SS type A sorting domain-containing protein n=1 Tax=Hymenobacter sp. 15J16-1T3B TaxID=2886941 RepID=UPI001D102D18|nr:T9SS type A sorting domain-containing protein [Hymenobacter sp. 15J16-1T3B]MCC3159273.1 T9SS type A sorting domain-containing protein [Hymenobacter sp. 15J16-1T3B]